MSVTRTSNVSIPERLTTWRQFDTSPLTPSVFTEVKTALRSKTGERLPKWRKVIKEGGNATTPFSAVWETREVYPTSLSHVAQYKFDTRKGIRGVIGYAGHSDGQGGRDPKTATISSSFADNLARAKFYKKVNEARNQFSGTIFLGELRETLHMLRRPAAGLTDLIKGYLGDVRKRKRSHPKTWTKAIGDLWLENAFGWQPLINDIKDAAKAIERLNEKRESKIISAGGFDAKDSTSSLPTRDKGATEYFVGNTGDSGMWFYCNANWYERCIVRYKGRLDAQVRTQGWDNWDLFGFRTEDFIPAAWELLPWSFLADYFSNIGDCLSSICVSTQGLKYVNRTEIKTTYYSGKLSAIGPTGNNMNWGSNFTFVSMTGSPGGFNLTRRTIVRAANSGISYPTLQFNAGLNSGQLANIAALLASSRALHPQNPRPLYRLPGM